MSFRPAGALSSEGRIYIDDGIHERDAVGGFERGSAVWLIKLPSSGISRSLDERRSSAPLPITLERRPMKEDHSPGLTPPLDHLTALMVEPAAEKERHHKDGEP